MGFNFSLKKAKPAVVLSDKIIPVYALDDNKVYRSGVYFTTLRFDDAMDAEKLRLGLVRLLELGNWRKLGARLRLNVSVVLRWNWVDG
jgi:hypothetical protein